MSLLSKDLKFKWEDITESKIKASMWEALRGLTPEQMNELYLPTVRSDGGRADSVLNLPEIKAIEKYSDTQSLAALLYLLAQVRTEYFDLIDEYSPNTNPFEPTSRYVGRFCGLDIKTSSEPRGLGWPINRKTVSVYLEMPSTAPWSVFQSLEKLLRPRTCPRQFLDLFSKCGWNTYWGQDVYIEATVKSTDRNFDPLNSNWSQRSYSDNRETNFELESIVLSVGGWSFTQRPNKREGNHANMLASAGYGDQLTLTRSRTKGMESVMFYFDPSCSRPPMHRIVRDEALDGLIGEHGWGENELRLAEMMEIREEIFLDKDDLLPIIEYTRPVTDEFIKHLHSQTVTAFARRREEIRGMFGTDVLTGTLKINSGEQK